MRNKYDFNGSVSEARLVYRLPEGGPREVKIEPPKSIELGIRSPTQKALDQLAKAVGERRALDFERKDSLRKELVKKNASHEAMTAFAMAYDPDVAPVVKKILAETKPKLNIHSPEDWKTIHGILVNPANKEYYSQVYFDAMNPELAPLVSPEKTVLTFSDEEAGVIEGKKRPTKVAKRETKAGRPVRRIDFPAELIVVNRPSKKAGGAVAALNSLPEKPNVPISEEMLERAFGENKDAVQLYTEMKAKHPDALKDAMAKFDELVKAGHPNPIARETVLAMWDQGLSEKDALALVDQRHSGSSGTVASSRD